jgi:formylglycine-generating enzyme
MVAVRGATFSMGSDRFYPEEGPVHEATVGDFWVDEHPVTNAAFRRFIAATGYVTGAEIAPSAADYPDADPALLRPGSVVFQKPPTPVRLDDPHEWWSYVLAARWDQPAGPGSTLDGRDDHPVVHVTFDDAAAYADWVGKELPTEAEWEYAARGGLDGAVFPWGDDPAPGGTIMANTWQGEFPWENLCLDGHEGTSPVGSFPPNGFGLFDVVGNVWEWTTDWFRMRHGAVGVSPCCAPGGTQPTGDPAYHARRTIKGGSHLCAPSYCLRYRPSARQGETGDTSTSHIGFRCIIREG